MTKMLMFLFPCSNLFIFGLSLFLFAVLLHGFLLMAELNSLIVQQLAFEFDSTARLMLSYSPYVRYVKTNKKYIDTDTSFSLHT